MPVSYRIDTSAGIVFTTWTGDVDFAAAVAHNDALRSDPDFRPSMNQLSDARGVTSTVSADGVRTLARTTPFGPSSRRAIVTSSDLVFGVSRQYVLQMRSEAPEIQLFGNMDAAREWLGLADEVERPA